MARHPNKRAALACLALALGLIAATVPRAAAARGAPSPPSWRPATVHSPPTHPAAHHSRKRVPGAVGSDLAQCTEPTGKCLQGNTRDPSPSSLPADKVNVWTSTCDKDKNDECCACDLWLKAQGQAGPSFFSKSDSNRAKIIPTVPLRGIESIRDKDNDDKINPLWKLALDAATANNLTGVTTKVTGPLALINPIHERSRHQLHIHVGQAKPAFYTCFASLTTAPPSPKWTWKKVALGSGCDKIPTGARTEAYAVSVPQEDINAAIREGIESTTNTFRTASKDIFADPTLVRVAAVVLPGKNGLYTVMLVTDVNDYVVFG